MCFQTNASQSQFAWGRGVSGRAGLPTNLAQYGAVPWGPVAVDHHEHLVDVLARVRKCPHAIHVIVSNLGGEHRSKSSPPEPHGLVAELYAALMQQVLDIPQ